MVKLLKHFSECNCSKAGRRLFDSKHKKKGSFATKTRKFNKFFFFSMRPSSWKTFVNPAIGDTLLCTLILEQPWKLWEHSPGIFRKFQRGKKNSIFPKLKKNIYLKLIFLYLFVNLNKFSYKERKPSHYSCRHRQCCLKTLKTWNTIKSVFQDAKTRKSQKLVKALNQKL